MYVAAIHPYSVLPQAFTPTIERWLSTQVQDKGLPDADTILPTVRSAGRHRRV